MPLFNLSGPAIIAPRHFHWLDIPVIAHGAKKVRRDNQLHFVSKEENRAPVIKAKILGKELKTPPLEVFGSILAGLGTTFIERGVRLNEQEAAVGSMEEVIEDNGLLLIFPEGTRSKTGKQGKIKAGTSTLAITHQMPVFPVGIAGTLRDESTPRGVEVYFGAPLSPPDVPGFSDMDVRQQAVALHGPRQELTAALLQAQAGADLALANRAA